MRARLGLWQDAVPEPREPRRWVRPTHRGLPGVVPLFKQWAPEAGIETMALFGYTCIGRRWGPKRPENGTRYSNLPNQKSRDQGNALSAGDKSTLALALFLAKVNADPRLSETIVVLDDPFTSLDHFRRQFTAIEIKKLCGRALQTIVLSHEKSFLRLLWDKIDHSIVSSLALQTGAPGITTIARYDIAAATQPRQITERTQIEEFLEGEPHEPAYIRTRLRTVCEDFYRNGDRALFGQAASLEEITRTLDRAGPGNLHRAISGVSA
jgi:hypothetical protein